MRRLVTAAAVVAFALGFGALVFADPPSWAGCPGLGKGKGNPSGPQFCKYCPEPDPGCHFFECSKCGCSYICGDRTVDKAVIGSIAPRAPRGDRPYLRPE